MHKDIVESSLKAISDASGDQQGSPPLLIRIESGRNSIGNPPSVFISLIFLPVSASKTM